MLIELTTKCNLRCAYCAVAQPDYVGVQFPVEHFDALTNLIVERAPGRLMINGHGETTIVKNWDVGVRHWLERGLSLEIITNLSKKLKDREVETLAQLEAITISTDSANPELFEALRRNAKWETFHGNLQRLVAAMAERDRPPVLSFSVVVSDICAPALGELVDYGLAHGVKHFEFCNLAKYPDVEGAIRIRHVGELPKPEREGLRDGCAKMLRTILEHGASFTWPEGLAQALDVVAPTKDEVSVGTRPGSAGAANVTSSNVSVEANDSTEAGPSGEADVMDSVDETLATPDTTPIDGANGGIATTDGYAAPPASEDDLDLAVEGAVRTVYPSKRSDTDNKGMTRGCLDPWSFAYLQSNTAVRICCFTSDTVGHLGAGESLDTILNSERVLEYRRGLLSGELVEACQNCWARPWVTKEKQLADVRAYTQESKRVDV